MPKNFIRAISTAQLDASTLSGNYDLLSILTKPCFMVRIVNASNLGVNVSLDHATLHDFVRANSDNTLMFQVNSQPNGKVALLRQGTSIYIQGTPVPATAGFIFFIGYYQEN
jgi:hypothetical protein